MLLNTNKISLIYDFWKLSTEDNYLQDATELSRKLTESDIIDAKYIQDWIPDLLYLVKLWEQELFTELDDFYMTLLNDRTSSDKVDTLLRFLYDIQLYELVKYLLEKNVHHYKQDKRVSSTMSGFHEACVYGFSQVCLLYLQNEQDINETFSLVYENIKTNKQELIRNLTGLQLVCLWSKYFPKRLVSYAHTLRLLLNHGARVNMISTELSTPLHWTCRAKHTTQLAQDLIEHGACVNACDKFNIQPIHYACWTRNRTLVDLFLSKGIQLTAQDDFGRTSIHFLCMPAYIEEITQDDQQGQYDLMKYLLNYCEKNFYSIDLTQSDHQGRTLLTYACLSHNLSLMQLLLEHQPDLLNKATIIGRTPLMIAIDECFLDGIEYLLQYRNLERDGCDMNGNTAVHYICMSRNTTKRSDMLKLLLNDKNGIFDFEKRTEQLIDPFMLCTVYQANDLCRLLIEKDVILSKQDIFSRQSLHVACQLGNHELVSLLLKSSKIDINALDANNRNCLFYALSSGNDKLVQLLIDNNVKINIQDVIGDTPLHLAVQHPTNACQLTKCLLSKPESKEIINESAADGMKPLLLAANFQQADIVYLLLKNGADINGVNNEQQTALHLACKSGSMTCAFYLIEVGGLSIDVLDFYQQTPLFYAFTSNDYDLVQYLLLCNARIDVRDSENYLPIHTGLLLSKIDEDYKFDLIDLYKGEHEDLLNDQSNPSKISPLLIACMQGKLEVVKYLISNYRVDILARCLHGYTALHYACLVKSKKSLDIIEFLMQNGCTYEQVDEPKGTFLHTVVRHGDQHAARYFIDYWLKTNPDINELHCGSTLLDLLYQRAQYHHHDLDVQHLRQLLEKGARLHDSKLPIFPGTLVNDCPLFYLTLLEYNCSPITDKTEFIIDLLNTISIYPDTIVLVNRKDKEYITVCEYFFNVIQLIRYFYDIEQFYSIINQKFLSQFTAEQSNDDTVLLKTRINKLQSTPLKLSEIARKIIRKNLDIPSQHNFQQLDLTKYLADFLSQNISYV
ncbi:unnamed protein product [Adineta ricciae]|uniref:Ankyrin repeat protein n=1 Tax=Adineta ricciae TaxID=249248 RepID=A0A813ZJT3_ADIRI|nr:unnamed protein product [Adineta ricciae]CAF1062844.1 unnamed protein product [Adineta ricciae]